MTRFAAIAASLVVVLGLVVGGVLALRGGDDPFADCRRGAVAGGAATIGGPFTLVDGSGRTVTDADVITGPTLVYFGYTFCPDICPTDVARNAQAAADLAARGDRVGQVFVTVDPARDTPELVRQFTAAIDPAIIGLSGTPEQVAAAAKAYKVYFRKSDAGDPRYYLMDHSTFTYLVAPGTGFLEYYPSDASADDIVASVACYAARL